MTEVNDNLWQFVRDNINADAMSLRLKYHGRADMDFDVEAAITQIECRRKFGKKLAVTLSRYPQWFFPSVLAGEQSTSDLLARYHASLILPDSTAADLTAGLGIDVLHIAEKCTDVSAVEIDAAKAAALEHNLDADTRITVHCTDCRDWIEKYKEKIGTVFIDPARRASDGSRIFAISQCQPDILAMMSTLSSLCHRLVVKLSPMIDITQTMRELPQAQRIISLGTETECKEIVAVIDFDADSDADSDADFDSDFDSDSDADFDSDSECGKRGISCVTLRQDGERTSLTFTPEQETTAAKGISYAMPTEGDYLYEPYPAVMKGAPYNVLAMRYDVAKLHPNTHLYVSPKLVMDFPGRKMKIERVIPYNSKYIKRIKKEYPRMMVATRNFDISSDKLRDKLGVKDGGDRRLYGITDANGNPQMLIVNPIPECLDVTPPTNASNPMSTK